MTVLEFFVMLSQCRWTVTHGAQQTEGCRDSHHLLRELEALLRGEEMREVISEPQSGQSPDPTLNMSVMLEVDLLCVPGRKEGTRCPGSWSNCTDNHSVPSEGR